MTDDRHESMAMSSKLCKAGSRLQMDRRRIGHRVVETGNDKWIVQSGEILGGENSIIELWVKSWNAYQL